MEREFLVYARERENGEGEYIKERMERERERMGRERERESIN